MRRIHGWTSIACATALTLSATLAASPAAQARRPARRAAPKPALATGTSDGLDAGWRLEGRRLTVRFAQPLRLFRDAPEADVALRCGDNAVRYAHDPVFADSAVRQVRVLRGARTVSVVLPRDVAARTNLCDLREVGEQVGALRDAAPMRLRRGGAPGCKPVRPEKVVHRGARVLVTELSVESADEMSGEDVYRLCRLPRGRLTPLARLSSGGGGGGGGYAGVRFASAGDWLAWSADYSSHAPGGENAIVEIVDIRSSSRSTPTRFATAPRTSIATNALDVAANGTAVWVERVFRSTGASGDVEQKLRVGWQFGRTETIASWAGPLADEQANALTDATISEDGRTVTWRAAGQQRSATIAVPDDSDPSAPAAVATGASADPAARFRLRGRDLTVTFDERLLPRGFRGRPSVRVVCGDNVRDPGSVRSLDGLLLAAKAERSLRIAPGARIVGARLDANIAARANWCGLRLRSRAGNRFASAALSLRAGERPACAPTAREEIVLDVDRVLVTQVRTRPTESGYWQSALRACDKVTHTRIPLGDSAGGDSSGLQTRAVTAAGTWVALVSRSWTKYDPQSSAALWMVDVSQPRPAGTTVWTPTTEESLNARVPTLVALAPSGRIAWIVAPEYGPGGQPPRDDQLLARALDGRVVTVATGPTNSLSDLAIGGDGATVTWRESGVPRSAPLP